MKKIIKEIKNVSYEYMGISITDEIAKKILNEHPTIKKFGADDTEERSNIINFICLDICGMVVPTYGDSTEYKQKFNKEIIENAISKGYVLDEETWNSEEY